MIRFCFLVLTFATLSNQLQAGFITGVDESSTPQTPNSQTAEAKTTDNPWMLIDPPTENSASASDKAESLWATDICTRTASRSNAKSITLEATHDRVQSTINDQAVDTTAISLGGSRNAADSNASASAFNVTDGIAFPDEPTFSITSLAIADNTTAWDFTPLDIDNHVSNHGTHQPPESSGNHESPTNGSDVIDVAFRMSAYVEPLFLLVVIPTVMVTFLHRKRRNQINVATK